MSHRNFPFERCRAPALPVTKSKTMWAFKSHNNFHPQDTISTLETSVLCVVSSRPWRTVVCARRWGCLCFNLPVIMLACYKKRKCVENLLHKCKRKRQNSCHTQKLFVYKQYNQSKQPRLRNAQYRCDFPNLINRMKLKKREKKTCDPIFHIFKDNCHNMGFSVLIVLGWRLAAQLILLISANSVTHLTPQWDGDSCRLHELRTQCAWTCKWGLRGPRFAARADPDKTGAPRGSRRFNHSIFPAYVGRITDAHVGQREPPLSIKRQK